MRLAEKILHFKRDSKGGTIVEFTLCLPLLILVCLGIYETTNYILLSQKLNEIASGVANWVSAKTTSAVVSDCLIGANLVGKDYNFSSLGTVVVTGIQTSGSPPAQAVVWRIASPGGITNITTNSGGIVTSSPFPLSLPPNLIVVEVSYSYTPIFSYFLSIFPPIKLLKVSQMVPRSGLTFNPLPAS